MRVFLNVLVLTIVCAGCGPKIIPIETAHVSGIATFEGKPLENYRVFLYCETDEAMEPATGIVTADGSFTLSVRKSGDGAIVGNNKVWLTYDPPMPEQVPGRETAWTPPSPKVKLAKKFMTSGTSGLTVEVPSSGITNYKLDLK